jgi:RHS repeat-associated protein
VAIDDSYSIHSPGYIGPFDINDSDPDGDSLTFSIVTFPSHGTLTFDLPEPTPRPWYRPQGGYAGTDSLTYQICDPSNACATATVTINIVNQAPLALADSYNVHNPGYIGSFDSNDRDPDGDGLRFSIVNGPTNGTLQFDLAEPTPRPWYTPHTGFSGVDSLVYQICDAFNACATATVTINVLNQAPVVVDDSYNIHNPGYIGSFDSNDRDPEGDGLRFSIVTQPAHGALQFDIPEPTPRPWYMPDNGFSGDDSLSYQLCDSFNACATATVVIHVVNQRPVAADDEYKVAGPGYIGPFDANDNDPDQDPLNFSIVTNPSHGILTFDNGVVSPRPFYTPDTAFVGVDSLSYKICDQFNACATASVILKKMPNDGLEDAGTTSCNMNVGAPVNVTNGNMYLQQTDYALPGIGPAIALTRTYNSITQSAGLFGKGWSTAYDESIKVIGSTYVRWFSADGQATNFVRATGSGPFSPVERDFHGVLLQNSDNSFTLSFGDGSMHRFNSAGRLTALADRVNNQTTLTYNTSSRLTSITDSFGRVLTVTTDTGGRVSSLKDALAAVATYSYGSNGELLSVTYPDNSAFHFAYTTAHGNLLLATVTDALANIIEAHAYDSQGRAVTSERHGGAERYTLSFVSTSETDATNALGHVTKYFFDESKSRNLVTSVQGLCSCGGGSQSQSWTYDDQLNVVGHTNALGQAVTYTYDSRGNKLSATSALGTASFTYNQFGEVLTATDAMGGVETNTYDAVGKLLSVIDALNNPTTLTYDARGQLLTMTNARGNTTTLNWDTGGHLTQTKDALGNITTLAYDARARLTKATDALGNATSFTYDAANHLIKITRADRSSMSYTYDLAGRRTKTTDFLGNVTTRAYDAAYRLTGETDALGKSVSYSYDLMSNLTGTTDQLGQTTNIVYDEFNRPEITIYPTAGSGAARLRETIEYDAVGNVIRRTDTAGRATTYEYDSANRLAKITDPALQATQYEYNPRSSVTAVVDALSQRYEFGFDALSRLTTVTRAGLQMSFAYDAVGNAIQRTDYNNLTTNYTYDALNRLTKIAYPDTTTATYAYDKMSRLTAAANINGTVSFVYDKLGQVTSATDVWGQAINYTYDADGRRTQTSFGANTFNYSYDAINRLTKIAETKKLATTYAYDAASRLTSRTLPNGIVTSYSYDGVDRLTRLLDAKGASVIVDNNYSYNDAGNITKNIDQSGTHVYGYDILDHLTSAAYPLMGNESYAYDAGGNRTSSHRSSTYNYQPNNRLTSTNTTAYVYDNNGNLISRSDSSGTTQLEWDFENRLTQVVTPAAGSVTYKYDALGRRVQTAPSSGAATNFTYDGDDIAQEQTSTGVITDYLNGPGIDNKIRQKTGTIYNYFSQDHLGSTTALTDSNGSLVERETYDAYGNTAGSARTRYGYTGRERDPVTGLMYYRARWYDAQVGRFISEDPIGLGGGINQFAYVAGNPQNAKDPSGLYEIDVHYYLTYYLALKTGCFKDWEAHEIANEDQKTDENPQTRPGYGNTEQQQMQNRVFHALHPGAREGIGSPLLWRGAMNESGGHQWIGRYLHYLQDTFSHRDYTSDINGHSPLNVETGGPWGDHSNDKTASDPRKARRMAGATWKALVEYGKAKKCNCTPKWDNSWWNQINDFIDVVTNDPRLSTIDAMERTLDNPGSGDPAALTRKRRILGLPDRYSGEW